MSVAAPRRYLAKVNPISRLRPFVIEKPADPDLQVQAKDERGKLELEVTANTTIGELLRYWDWRSGDAADTG